jgi:N-acyl-D-amino-acid deacylase
MDQVLNVNYTHMKPTCKPIAFLLLLAFATLQCSRKYDLVISGGTLYDGSGGAPFKADIGIVDGTIRHIGRIRAGNTEVIDAKGLYLSPGFIDMHTHCDGGLRTPGMSAAQNYLTQGVTTVVTGNCGSGTYRVEEYFDLLDSIGIGPNVVHLVGHGTLRGTVMGQEDRAPTKDEMKKMKELLNMAMKQGADGMSTGLFYAPGSYAKTGEIIELVRELKAYNGIYASHIRDEGSFGVGLLASVEEAITIGETAGVPVQISHIKALGKPVWGLSGEVTAMIAAARGRGVKVMADQYPYTASNTGLSAAVLPRWVQAGGATASRLTDPDLLPGIRDEMASNIEKRGGPGSLVIISYAGDSSYNGKSLAEISELQGTSPVETAIGLILHGGSGVISFNMDESDVLHFMQQDYVMTCSDGHVQALGQGMPHPRNFGAFTRKIRKYVIEDEIITMEKAIRAATSLPAEMLGLTDRGKIAEGYAADLVIFDPRTIRDRATFTDPHHYSEGIIYLLVNGEPVIERGTYNGKLAGKTLRMDR